MTSRKKGWPSRPLCKKLTAAAKGSLTGAQRVEVSFLVEGGAPGERFFEHVVIDSDGNAQYEVEDKLLRRRRRTANARLDPTMLRSAFVSARDCARGEYRPYAQQIPPDSLVGSVTVRSGEQRDTVHFPIEQAETVRKLATAQSRLKLHSGKKLATPRRALPLRFVRAVESLSKIAALVERKQSRASTGGHRRTRRK